MKKLLLSFLVCFFMAGSVFAAEIPQQIKDFINKDFPGTDFRFDGAIILPDNTMYLLVYPSKPVDVQTVQIKTVYPTGQTFKKKPDMAILNNRYTLLKIINVNGKKTVLNMTNPPDELQSGLLSQDLLPPKGLVIPKSLMGIVGDLDLSIAQDKN